MVAAVIEDLLHRRATHSASNLSPQAVLDSRNHGLSSPLSPFGSIVDVVPGEADSFCAAHARSTGAAVLSNDSDIFVYDLGNAGSFLTLGSLSVTKIHDEHGKVVIGCKRFWPQQIARQLQVESIPRLAFHRTSDTCAPRYMIFQHARQPLAGIAIERYRRFMEEYQTPVTTNNEYFMLNSLDPRVCELYLQFYDRSSATSSDPCVYLPVMLENPTRTASWTYGYDIRRLAYSLLNLSVPADVRHGCVHEYQRRGNGINPVVVTLMTLSEAMVGLSKVLTTVETIEQALSYQPNDWVLYWRIFGLHQVCERLKRQGKPPLSQEWMTEFIVDGYVGGGVSWDDFHAYSNAQAVIYSMRMFKQLLCVMRTSMAQDLQEAIKGLERFWAEMPSLSQLIVPIRDLPLSLRSASSAHTAIENVHKVLSDKK